ncbi:MAG: type II toxin-antitoxin system prevent-host-death family antitoxin [Actinomycetota bacterium]
MVVAAVAELKARLSSYLKAVKSGGEVIVTERGKPIARLVPFTGPEANASRVAELVRAGMLRQGTGRLPRSFWTLPRPKDPRGRGLAYLLEERAEDR